MLRLLLACLLPSLLLAQWHPQLLWDQQGAEYSSHYGYRILPLGDQNNDGFADFGVWAAGSAVLAGSVSPVLELYHGGNPPSLSPYFAFRADSNIAMIWDAKDIGDVNGDGFVDLLVEFEYLGDTVMYYPSVYWGGPAFDATPDVVFRYTRQSWSDIVRIGDFNGDGFDDLYHYAFYGDSGRAFWGGVTMDTLADWTKHRSPWQYTQIAYPKSFGDINHDGFSDWMSVNADNVLVFFGGADPDTLPDAVFACPERSSPDAIVADLTTDGFDDVVAGAYLGAWLWAGGVTLDSIIDGHFEYPCEGGPNRIVGLGDINRDGYNDMGMATDNCDDNPSGIFSLYLGSPWLSPWPVWTFHSNWEIGDVWTAAGLGDVDGDGTDDFGMSIGGLVDPVGSRGRVLIYRGDPTFRLDTPQPQTPLPTALTLTAFPNPFNSSTEIRYALPRSSHVSLRVFDVTGRAVAALVDRAVAAGEQRVMWDAEGVASGVYFVRLAAAEQVLTRKMLLVR